MCFTVELLGIEKKKEMANANKCVPELSKGVVTGQHCLLSFLATDANTDVSS